MTTEEKLEHFHSFCIEDARSHSTKMLAEYTSALEETFKLHQADALRRAKMQLEAETAKNQREINKQLSIEQINIKRTLGHKQDELKDMLFSQVMDMLEHFMRTSDYTSLLDAQIIQTKEVAGKEPLIIYMDPVDEEKTRALALFHQVEIRISEYSFSGGTRAVIPSKNIVIDHSFHSKLAEARENFCMYLNIHRGGKLHD